MTRPQREGTPAPIGIVHLGPGAFFRAFNAIYTHDAMEHAGGDWGILAVSLQSATARDQLMPQGGVYTSVTLGVGSPKPHRITSISEVMVAPEDPRAVVDAMANPSVKIVSLTVTEKGYCHDPATGTLNLTHPDIAHDLSNSKAPKSAIGFLTAALSQRMERGHAAFTVLPCDNLPGNGHFVRGLVLEFARAMRPAVADWIETHATFPATMVDRITPATTAGTITALARDHGIDDPACVAHEAFRQWVIEDDFVDGRPAWDQVGAQMVHSVTAHEEMKLRSLNGTHSTLAYLGYLAGHETIADCVADPPFAALCQRLWRDEIIPVITKPDGEDLPTYCAKLMERYRDPAIRHRTWQIAMDGSQKLPQRLLGTIRDNLSRGRVPAGLCLAVAGWMRYVGGVDENGQEIDVRDPLADRLRQISRNTTEPVPALLAVEDIFCTDLVQNARFVSEVTNAYNSIATKGARATVATFTGAESRP